MGDDYGTPQLKREKLEKADELLDLRDREPDPRQHLGPLDAVDVARAHEHAHRRHALQPLAPHLYRRVDRERGVVPQQRLDYRPDPKARSAAELAWLLASEEAGLVSLFDLPIELRQPFSSLIAGAADLVEAVAEEAGGLDAGLLLLGSRRLVDSPRPAASADRDPAPVARPRRRAPGRR